MAITKNSVVIPVQLDRSPPPHVEARYDDHGDGQISMALVGSLTPSQVVVLGYWPVPDQSSPQQLRDQFEDEARLSLDAIMAPFEEQRFEVVSELSFTKDRAHLIDRTANMYDCTAVLSPGTVRTDPPESVLVLLKSDSDIDRMVTTLGTLFTESELDILLFNAVESGDDPEAVKYLLRGVAERLADRGIDPDRIQWKQSDGTSRVDIIVSEVSNHDLVVLGESEPSVRERLFGPVQSAVTDRTDRPSLTIRADA